MSESTDILTQEQFQHRVVQWAKRLHPHNKGICLDTVYESYLVYSRCKNDRERNLAIAEAAMKAADDSKYWEGKF